tara:strand:- start:830 stop:1726 length:897 start_codon:yes stop_codon:yes gene_type:complete
MRGNGAFTTQGKLHAKQAAAAETNRALYSRRRYVCWVCQKEGSKSEVTLSKPYGFESVHKVVCHECSTAAQKRKQEQMKKIAWSHSSLKDYEGCARRYHEVKILKKYPFVETEATRYGTVLHKVAEDYVAEGVAIPPEYGFVKETLDALIAKPGRKLAEIQMALTQDLQVCDWKAKDAWVRGIADLLILDDENMTAWVIDYKTGNDKYPDRDQLRLMSIMVFKYFPHIRKVNSALLFVVKNSMVKHSMTVDEADAEWWRYRERVAKIEASVSNDVWNPTRTPLCGWCPCTGCEFHKRR